MTTRDITWTGGPTSFDGINAGYWRLTSAERVTPPYTFSGRVRLNAVMDPPVFGYGWQQGVTAPYDPGLNWHPLYPSNSRNVGIGIGRRNKPTRVSCWAEMRDVRPDDPYGSRSGYEYRDLETIPDPMDGDWHQFRCEVFTAAHYALHWDGRMVADIMENDPPTIDPGYHSVGLRLDFCDIDLADMKVTQHMTTHTGQAADPFMLPAAVRVLDTRESNERLPHKRNVPLSLTGSPPAGATAAIVSLVAVNPHADGYLCLWAGGRRPGTSNVNYRKGENQSGFAIVPIGPNGEMWAYTSAGADLVLDLIGYTR